MWDICEGLTYRNGEKVLGSHGYSSTSSCKNGIASVKVNAPPDSRYEKNISSNNLYYFVLKTGNVEVIGTSEMYQMIIIGKKSLSI